MHMWSWGMVGVPFLFGPFIGLFFVLAVWSVFWKGLALWHAGQRGHPWWFIIMLVVNTAGILEIVYLFVVLKLRLDELFVVHAHHNHEHHTHGR